MESVIAWLAAGQPPHWVWLALAGVLLWEGWLGQTARVRGNSTLAVLGDLAVRLLRRDRRVAEQLERLDSRLPPPPPNHGAQ